MDQIKIGKFIAELRKEQNMTQLDLATKLGITDRAVSKWENGRGLPDISLIQPLCETLDISINELLNGERIPAEQTLEIANQNIIGMLSDRKNETKKRKRTTVICVILTIITIVLGIVCSMIFGSQIAAQIRGDGYSFSAASATRKAERVTKYIYNGDYKKAAELIGFHTKDRDIAEKQWCTAMSKLFDSNLKIEQFSVSPAIEDDEFISGNGALIVFDRESQRKYIYDVGFAQQDGGITFGVHSNYLYETTNESRAEKIGKLIDQALSTWFAG